MTISLRNFGGIILGAVITAVALNMFLIPNKVAAGGVSGLATVLHHLVGSPVGLTMIAFDIPLLLLSMRVIGARFGVNTIFGAATLSLSIDLLAPYIPVVTGDLLLASLYGGVMAGIGLGIVFRFDGSTAGTDLAAAMLNKLFGFSIGQALLGIDFFVIAAAGLAFQSAELSLYALISLFTMTQIIDLVQEGPTSAKTFFIMSSQATVMAKDIFDKLDRGVTFLQARGGYTGQPKEIIFCVVSKREITKLKEIVYANDKHAFVIVADAHEVLGEGFKKYNS